MEDRLKNYMLGMGYQRLDSNTPGIYLYYHIQKEQINIVSVIHASQGNEMTTEQYVQLLDQAKNNFRRIYPHHINLLSLILTRFPDRAKKLFSMPGKDSHWIVDTSINRLMVYEMQVDDFKNLKTWLEHNLDSEVVRKEKTSTDIPFTLWNTSIIVINIVVFFLSNFTGIFGGEMQSFYHGSLSWYYVIEEKQIYRLITSMFLHAGWSHLANNMFVLLFIGSTLEQTVGKMRYLIIYFGTGMIAGLTSIGYNMWKENAIFVAGDSVMAVGASGAIFGLVGALLCIVLINKGHLQEISTKRIIIFICLSLYSGIVNPHIDQAAHIGGFLSGMLLALLLYRRSNTLKQQEES